MDSWISRHPLLSFYGLTLVLSWSYWFALLATGKTVAPGNGISHLPGLFGPALAAFIIVALLEGKSGVTSLLARCVRWRGIWPLGVGVVLAPAVIGLSLLWLMDILDKPFPGLGAFQAFPGLPAAWPMWLILLSVLISNGFGEEIGWRGFATERWLPKYGPFWTSLQVAGLWMFWHLPLFWLNTSMRLLFGPMVLGWGIALVSGAFVMTFLYQRFGHSILLLSVWHLSFNMMTATEAAAGIPAAAISTLVMIWGIVIAWRWWKTSA